MPVPLKRVGQSIGLVILAGAFLFMLVGVERHPYSSLVLNIYHLDGKKEILVYDRNIKIDEEIILAYTHSSDGTPVEQVFLVDEAGGLKLLTERYRWYGAGLEFGSDYTISHEDGWIQVTGYERRFETLPVRVAATVTQYLIIGSEEISLAELAPAGSRLLIRAETSSKTW